MSQQPEALYLGILLAFLVLMRSPWPWTRGGGFFWLVASAAFFGWVGWRHPSTVESALEPTRLPPTLLALLVALIVWWSLHRAGSPAAPVPGAEDSPLSSRRLVGLTFGLSVISILASVLGAPSAGDQHATSWFLAGLVALAPITGTTFAFVIVPAVAVIGLLLAPNLDAHDRDGPIDGRRDEVPFFLFAWLAVGVIPIVLAAWRPEFGQVEARGLAERFWLDWAGVSAPRGWALRELPGFMLYLVIFLGLPWRLPKWKASKGVFGRHLRRLGPLRYGVMMTLAGLLVLVPFKVALFVLLDVGPWIVVGDLAL